jgi:hypothetical protein
VAASGPTHAIDGWSFVGRSVQSLMRGDVYSAIHFGYYAELRAAMSLLATEGFGVFDKRHPVVEGVSLTRDFPECRFTGRGRQPRNQRAGTHAIVVPVLRYWSTLSRAADLLDEIVQPAGIPLSTWLNAFGAHARRRAVALRWMNAWGLDLSQIEDDHDARNLVSYRPSQLRRPTIASVDQVAAFIRDLWTLFEPSANFRFPNLEGQLLSRALSDCGVTNPPVAAIEGLGLSAAEAKTWSHQLSDPTVPVPLAEAGTISPIESERCAMQVISRASLLLFVATRSASLHLHSARYTRADLNFWWQQFGIERCLWSHDAIPEDPRDVWADMRDALDDLEASLVPPAPVSPVSWRRKLLGLNRSPDDFGAWELIAVWGLVP